jgi:trans-aconitate 2-methyltransferase
MRDPDQYALFSDERSRPFYRLLERIPDRPYRDIVDLGCGTGELTRRIAERFPSARVIGLDSSEQMLASSEAYAVPGRLEFVLGDMADYAEPADLVFSNAALHWLRNHEAVLPRLISLLRPGGVLAVQMPLIFSSLHTSCSSKRPARVSGRRSSPPGVTSRSGPSAPTPSSF